MAVSKEYVPIFYPEDGGKNPPRNIVNYTPFYMDS